MRSPQLILCHLLDPRRTPDAALRPIHGAVNIPFAELPQRTHELPPRGQPIDVVGPRDVAEPAVVWLHDHGRRARAQTAWHYAAQSDPPAIGRLWSPTAYLAELVPRLQQDKLIASEAHDRSRLTALDLACGTGRDAVYLASEGWRVTAVDVLPDALDRARDLAARCAPAIEPSEFVQLDLEHPPLSFPHQFDLIIVFRYLHRPLFDHFPNWLAPGGSLLCETFTSTHRARHHKPASEANVLQPGELPQLAEGLEIVDCSEAWRGDIHTARLWARRSAAADAP